MARIIRDAFEPGKEKKRGGDKRGIPSSPFGLCLGFFEITRYHIRPTEGAI
jgi:hypothetical protein